MTLSQIVARVGLLASPETKEKMRQAKLGKKLSEETKDKIRQAMLKKTEPLESNE